MNPFCEIDVELDYFDDLEFDLLPGLYKGMPIYLEESGAILLYVEDGYWLLKDADACYLSCSVKTTHRDDNICIERAEDIPYNRWCSSMWNEPAHVVSAFNDTPMAQVATMARGRIRKGTIEWEAYDEDKLIFIAMNLNQHDAPLVRAFSEPT